MDYTEEFDPFKSLSAKQGLGKRLFLENAAPDPAQNSRSRAGVETWERLSLEDPESKAREPVAGGSVD